MLMQSRGKPLPICLRAIFAFPAHPSTRGVEIVQLQPILGTGCPLTITKVEKRCPRTLGEAFPTHGIQGPGMTDKRIRQRLCALQKGASQRDEEVSFFRCARN